METRRKMIDKMEQKNMKAILFLLSYSKMRISVMLGIRKTSYPLNIKWWWQHQNYLKLGDVYIN
ncbi:MAG TPA: hypothetical protein VF679_06630 [Pedobacter sp.]